MHQPYDYLSLLEEMHLFTELVFDTKCILFYVCLSSDGKKLTCLHAFSKNTMLGIMSQSFSYCSHTKPIQ